VCLASVVLAALKKLILFDLSVTLIDLSCVLFLALNQILNNIIFHDGGTVKPNLVLTMYL